MRAAAVFASVLVLATGSSAQNWCPRLLNYYTGVRIHSSADPNSVWQFEGIQNYTIDSVKLAPFSTDRSVQTSQQFFLPEVQGHNNFDHYPGRFAVVGNIFIKTRCVTTDYWNLRGRQCAGLLYTEPPRVADVGSNFAFTLDCESCQAGAATGCTFKAVGSNVHDACVQVNATQHLVLDQACGAPEKFDIRAY